MDEHGYRQGVRMLPLFLICFMFIRVHPWLIFFGCT